MDSAGPSIKVVSNSRDFEVSSASLGVVSKNQIKANDELSKDSSQVALLRDEASKTQATEESDKSSSSQDKLSKKEIENSVQNAKKKAKQLENAFARINGQIKVSFEGAGSEINFQVTEAKTGKIIRKFPPPEAQTMLDLLEVRNSGILVDESA